MPVNRTALLLAFSAALFWAMSQAGSSTVIDRTSPALYVILIEVFFLLIAIFYSITHTRLVLRFALIVWQHRRIRLLIITCAASIFVYEVAFYYALSEPEKLLAIVIASLWPLFTLMWGRVLAIASWRSFTFRELVLVVVAFLGASLVTADRFHFAFGSFNLKVIVLAGVAAIAGGFWDASINRVIQEERRTINTASSTATPAMQLSNTHIVILSLIFARLLLVPIYAGWFLIERLPTTASPDVLLTAAAITLFGYVISDILFSIAISYSSASIVSIPYLVPIITMLLFKLIFSESVSAITLIGLYLVFFANFMLHTKLAKLSPATGAAIFFILVVCGALVIDPNSVKLIVGSDKNYDTALQLVMAVVTVALGFLLQQADGRVRDERAYFSNLLTSISQLSTAGYPRLKGRDPTELITKILALRWSSEPISSVFQQDKDLVAFFARDNAAMNCSRQSTTEASVNLAFEQWYVARQSLDDAKDSWFLGALIFAIGLSIVLTSVATWFLIILSAVGASLLCYLWILLNWTLLAIERNR
jgi:drug/metabolite transporter (DMT)-like permease